MSFGSFLSHRFVFAENGDCLFAAFGLGILIRDDLKDCKADEDLSPIIAKHKVVGFFVRIHITVAFSGSVRSVSSRARSRLHPVCLRTVDTYLQHVQKNDQASPEHSKRGPAFSQ